MRVEPEELLETLIWLDGYYTSADGLSRPTGLSVNGKPDFEGIAAWVLDVFASSRLAGLTVEASRRNVVHAIQEITEWQQKHTHNAAALKVVPEAFRPVVGMDRGEFVRALHRLDVFYKGWNGLQRPEGLSKNGRPDFEAIAAWIFGVYVNNRLENRSPEDSWDRVVAELRATDEWKAGKRTPVDTSTLTGKHLAGYQGWFCTPNDGTNNGWDHWFHGNAEAHGPAFDLWPDTRELFDSELEATTMTMRAGGPARLYSCHNPRTIRRHFDWMADAGIDGVSIGRFLNGTDDATTIHRLDNMLRLIRESCAATGRVFFVWYDVSKTKAATFVSDLRRDWGHLVNQVGVTHSSRYLHHNGRPLVGIWGAGANTCDASPAQWIEAINSFKSDPHLRSSVLIGCSRDWRTHPEWAPVLATADVVAPWTVMGWRTIGDANAYRRDVLEGDLALVKSRNLEYMPVVWPGFSSRHLSRLVDPIDIVPRDNGGFYWRQVFNAVEAGSTCLFTAMYDEVDEGTATFKMVETQEDVPVQSSWLTLDANGRRLPSDWYLRLAGAATRMLRKEIAVTAAIPINPST